MSDSKDFSALEHQGDEGVNGFSSTLASMLPNSPHHPGILVHFLPGALSIYSFKDDFLQT